MDPRSSRLANLVLRLPHEYIYELLTPNPKPLVSIVMVYFTLLYIRKSKSKPKPSKMETNYFFFIESMR